MFTVWNVIQIKTPKVNETYNYYTRYKYVVNLYSGVMNIMINSIKGDNCEIN